MSVLMEFSMSPIDQGESLSRYVARCIDVVDRSGLPYKLNPMGTIMEGEWDACLAVITECFDNLRRDCTRISCSIKVDFRAGKEGRLESKIASVEQELGRHIRQ